MKLVIVVSLLWPLIIFFFSLLSLNRGVNDYQMAGTIRPMIKPPRFLSPSIDLRARVSVPSNWRTQIKGKDGYPSFLFLSIHFFALHSFSFSSKEEEEQETRGESQISNCTENKNSFYLSVLFENDGQTARDGNDDNDDVAEPRASSSSPSPSPSPSSIPSAVETILKTSQELMRVIII